MCYTQGWLYQYLEPHQELISTEWIGMVQPHISTWYLTRGLSENISTWYSTRGLSETTAIPYVHKVLYYVPIPYHTILYGSVWQTLIILYTMSIFRCFQHIHQVVIKRNQYFAYTMRIPFKKKVRERDRGMVCETSTECHTN